MAVTIYDVAKKANKTPTTVSLALNGNKRVGSQTRSNILRIAEELNYKPNLIARALGKGRTGIIAFVFNFSSVDFSQNLSYAELFNAISTESSTYDYRVLFQASAKVRPLSEIFDEVRGIGAEAVFLATSLTSKEDKEVLENVQIPTILFNREFVAEKVTCLMRDDINAAKKATEHLISLGHKRIAFAGKSPFNEVAERRYKGYVSALQDNHLPVDHDIVLSVPGEDIDAGELAGLRLANLSYPPTAVVAVTDFMAIGIVTGLSEKELSVPKDVSVISFDNLHLSRFSRPPLSSVGFDLKEAAEITMKTFNEMLCNKQAGHIETVKSKMFPRRSTARIESGAK